MKPTRICSIDGCGRKHSARGYCNTHWKRWRATQASGPRKYSRCRVEGCDGAASRGQYIQGYCNAHYLKLLRTGDPLTPAKVLRFPENLLAYADKSGGVDACWPWLSARTNNGYGVVTRAGRSLAAHRAMYEFKVGPIPEGLQLDHLCRNRACVNPAHLEPVTQSENMLRAARARSSA